MRPTLCERVLCELERRLSEIARVDHYATNAGLGVYRARHTLAPDELPAIVLFDDGEAVSDASGAGSQRSMTMALSITVDAHVRAGQACSGSELERVKGDVKRALCQDRGALVDATGPIGVLSYVGAEASPRADGAQSEATSLRFTAHYKEAYGDPTQTR